jgi:hypothetical protein
MTTCFPCDEGKHNECNGLVRVIDQDGSGMHLCTCHCNEELVEETCHHCHGKGKTQRRMYGKNRKRAAQNSGTKT